MPPVTTTRQEKDSFGNIEVATERLWGAQTQRSLEHFAISTEHMPDELLHALAMVKASCANVNRELGRMQASIAAAIILAADEVRDGRFADEFPLSVWQTGSGTWITCFWQSGHQRNPFRPQPPHTGGNSQSRLPQSH